MNKINFSLIIPIFNEEENIERLIDTLIRSLSSNKLINKYEIICMDDCSTDKSLELLEKAKAERLHQKENIKIYSFTKRKGQSAGIAAGVKVAKYEVLGIIDADLQTDPEDFKKMIPKLFEGYDCINGARYHRKDPFSRRMTTKIARGLHQFFLKDNFYDITCPLKVMRAECLKSLTFYNTFHRFIPVLVQMQGFKVIEIGVTHRPRIAGKSKYGLWNRLKVARQSFNAVKWMTQNYVSYEFKKRID